MHVGRNIDENIVLQRLKTLPKSALRIFGAAGPKVRSLFKNFYEIPWCAPTWGWKEFRVTLQCIFSGRASRGTYQGVLVNSVKDFLGVKYALPGGRGAVA